MATIECEQTTEQLVNQLDAKLGAAWNLYRGAMGQWCVQIRNSRTDMPDAEIVSGPTIEAALQKSVEYVPMPSYQRRPEPFYRIGFEARKTGSNWKLMYGTHEMCFNLPTKKAAEAAADNIATRREREMAEWDRVIGPLVASGIEGVTFKWRT